MASISLRVCVAFAALAATACRAPRPVSAGGDGAAPALTYESIMAPQVGGTHRELRRLEALSHHPSARLRTARLLLETHQSDRAISELNVLLYGPVQPGPSVESFARFLRAEAFESSGDAARAARERELARACAVDPRLRAELDRRSTVVNAPQPAVAAFRVLPRDRWNARPPRPMTAMGAVQRITVHHSATLARDHDEAAAVAAIRAIQRYHLDQQDWADIGYHYLIDPAGRVWQGRDARWQGAHSGRANNPGNLGICLLGNFVRRSQQPSQAQIESLATLLDSLIADHGLTARAISTHGELKTTTCPGDNLQAVVDRMRGFSVAGATE